MLIKQRVGFEDFFSKSLVSNGCIILNFKKKDDSYHKIKIKGDHDRLSEVGVEFTEFAFGFFIEIVENVSFIEELLSEGYLLAMEISLDIQFEDKSGR